MKTHSCSSAPVEVSAKSAVPMLRAGLTDVRSMGMAMRCSSISVKPAIKPPKPGANLRVVVNRTTITRMAVRITSVTMAAPTPKYGPDHRLAANEPRSKSSRPLAMPRMMAPPAIAPISCPMTANTACAPFTFFARNIPSVTAGLMWQPLIGPMT